MLELAIAEAYRSRPQPRPPAVTNQSPPSPLPARSATFSTNPNARASFLSTQPRTLTAPSRNGSIASHSRSYISFISRRGPPNSFPGFSARTAKPREAVRADSVFSQAFTTPTHAPCEPDGCNGAPTNLTQAALRPFPHVYPSLARPTRDLPVLPASVPLPPQEELTHFDIALQFAIEDLQSAPPQATDVALTVLEHMTHIFDLASCIATSWPEFYALILHAAKLVVSVLPARAVAARNMLGRCLAEVARRWNEEENRDTIEIAQVVGQVLDSAVQERRMLASRLGREFARWLVRERGSSEGTGEKSIRMLILGVSRAVLVALQEALAEDPGLRIYLEVLMASHQKMPPPPSYERLHITVRPTCAIGTASQRVDVFLLGSSSVCITGDLECQGEALGAAVCVKTLSPRAKNVALGGIDSIAISIAAGLSVGETGDVHDESPEAVPSNFVDLYVTQNGVLNIEELQRLAQEAEELSFHIFKTDSS